MEEKYKIYLRLSFVFVSNLVFNVWVNYEAFNALHQYKTNHVERNGHGDHHEKYKDGYIGLVMFTVVGGLLLLLTPIILFWKKYDILITSLLEKCSYLFFLLISYECESILSSIYHNIKFFYKRF